MHWGKNSRAPEIIYPLRMPMKLVGGNPFRVFHSESLDVLGLAVVVMAEAGDVDGVVSDACIHELLEVFSRGSYKARNALDRRVSRSSLASRPTTLGFTSLSRELRHTVLVFYVISLACRTE